MQPKGRVLIAKPGLDGHDRGAKVVARMLRDSGFEVIYTGLHQTIDSIVASAIQEDVDVIGLSIMSGAHNTLVPDLLRSLAERGIDDIAVTLGGIVPAKDIPPLKAAGVAEVFTPGATMAEIDEAMTRIVDEIRTKRESIRT